MEPQVWKIVQKRAYDLLSHRYGLLLVFLGAIAVTVSAFHFGEALLEWSHEKYAVVFNSYSDNIAGRSFRNRLCLPVPIDVVYTWVNGSDPRLLVQLRQIKLSMEEELNVTRPGKCTFSNCVPAPIAVATPALPEDVSLTELKMRNGFLSNVSSMFNISIDLPGVANVTAFVLPSWQQAEQLAHHVLATELQNYTLKLAHYTSDSTLLHTVAMTESVLMTGFPHDFTSDRILTVLPDDHRRNVEQVELHAEKGVAVLHLTGRKEGEAILQIKNFTIEGKTPAFTVGRLVWDLTDFSRDEDVSNSRFEDNEELRYSLRSLEKFAPWVRHIYIVTNGQIPYWLNLDNPRITLVTHEEIFPNKSHLPTFSSPAIESHLHRIPGLSDKFLYFNDDVMFGSEVWPDDFFSHATGQKLYLTWPVPSCNEACPSNWIRDGYCDKACNSSECEWDGGDCSGVHGQVQLGAGFQAVFGQQSQNTDDYCHSGCANNWIADKYCDQACNHLPCGFDAGDCGTDNFHHMHGIVLRTDSTVLQHYHIPDGESLAFFNLTDLLEPGGRITSAKHDPSSAVRAAAVSNKFKVLTLLLYPNRNATMLKFYLQGRRDGEQDSFQMNFTVSVNTTAKIVPKDDKAMNKTTVDEDATFIFEDYPKKVLYPHVPVVSSHAERAVSFPFNISSDFTEEGFQIALARLHKTFHSEIIAWSPRAVRSAAEGKKESAHQPLDPMERAQDRHHRDTVAGSEHGKQPVDGALVDMNAEERKKSEGEQVGDSNDVVHGQAVRDVVADSHKKDNAPHSGPDNRADSQGKRKLLADMEGEDVVSKQEDGGNIVEMVILDTETTGKPRNSSPDPAKHDGNSDMTDDEFLKFVKSRGDQFGQEKDGLPWEAKGLFSELEKRQKELAKAEVYETDNRKGRRLMDTFGDSLRHVNRLFNKEFGYAARKVPGHMPHMIDKNIMAELQDIFPNEWAVTSSHRVRSRDDMQFAFSYYYFLLGAVVPVDPARIFDEMDTDFSGVLSDREIRTLATRLYDLPLYLETLTGLETMFINCSEHLHEDLKHLQQQQTLALTNEQYYDTRMPQVTKLLFTNCPPVADLVKEKIKAKHKYKTTIMDESDIAFKMIHGNVSKVVGQLDDVRKHPKKFICLNDNIDHGSEEAKTVKAVVQDFYEALLPVPSQFELPREYRNRFLHVQDLEEWKSYRDWLRFWAHLALVILVLFTIASYFGDKIEALQRKLSRRQRATDSSSSSEVDESPQPAKSPPLVNV
ncbi:hypothetical protein BaRGS_00028317 [Batillaria attramentaria]|uniref:LNR domain-containing protein n=1 Tax=Batillaria attramentaria TaxID=370345 RepID=A0ABD0K009_9CAEN